MATQSFEIESYPKNRALAAVFSKWLEGKEGPKLSFRVRKISIARDNRPVGKPFRINISVSSVKRSLDDGVDGWKVKGYALRNKRPYYAEASWNKSDTTGTNRLHLNG